MYQNNYLNNQIQGMNSMNQMPQNYFQPSFGTQPMFTQNSQQKQSTNIQWVYVNGIDGAKAQIVQPSTEVWMMDNNEPIEYYKAVDSAGKPTLRVFKIVDITDQYNRNPLDNIQTQQIDVNAFATKEELNKIASAVDIIVQRFDKFASELGGSINE